MTTPTFETVTDSQYNSGSSARCKCGLQNFFLVPLREVTFVWTCCSCGEDNFHPNYVFARDRISHYIAKLEQQKAQQ